jgi:hypothetical protein
MPLIERWPENASSDLEAICTWWAAMDDAGVKILTSGSFGLVVLDVGGNFGEDNLHAPIEANGARPDSAKRSAAVFAISFHYHGRLTRYGYGRHTRIPAANRHMLEGT